MFEGILCSSFNVKEFDVIVHKNNPIIFLPFCTPHHQQTWWLRWKLGIVTRAYLNSPTFGRCRWIRGGRSSSDLMVESLFIVGFSHQFVSQASLQNISARMPQTEKSQIPCKFCTYRFRWLHFPLLHVVVMICNVPPKVNMINLDLSVPRVTNSCWFLVVRPCKLNWDMLSGLGPDWTETKLQGRRFQAPTCSGDPEI